MPEEIKQKIHDELRLLETELRTEIPQDLKLAVAMGDLSENAEYTAARNRQDYVRARNFHFFTCWARSDGAKRGRRSRDHHTRRETAIRDN